VLNDIELSGLVTTDSDSWPGGRIFTVRHDDGLMGLVITDSDSDSMWDNLSKRKSASGVSSSMLVAGVIGNSE